ncbi:hypothetical protein OA497_00835 [Alphaproteobacteria bacterium]|nr:hypothetical protein [Alphaproteobacteria bacterium]
MNNTTKDNDKKKIAKLKEKIQELENEIFNLKNPKKNKDLSILNDQFSEEINLEKLKEDK